VSEINVTPTEDLVMEVLAARVRGGEGCWTFANTHLRALRSLQAKGLLRFGSAPTPKAQRAYLTDLGRATYLSAGYTEPVTRLREQLAEEHRRIETAAAARRVVAERISRTEDENRRLRRQVRVLAAHLGGVTKGAHLDALLWYRDVQVLHQDGSTTTGKLGIAEDGDGYVVDTPNGPRPIQPVGNTGVWGPNPGVDVVRPLTL